MLILIVYILYIDLHVKSIFLHTTVQTFGVGMILKNVLYAYCNIEKYYNLKDLLSIVIYFQM